MLQPVTMGSDHDCFKSGCKREAKGQHRATLDDASRRGGSQRACQSAAAGAGRCQGVDIAQDACTLPLLYLAFPPTKILHLVIYVDVIQS